MHVTLTGKKGSCILGLLLAIYPISKFFLGKDQKNTYKLVFGPKKNLLTVFTTVNSKPPLCNVHEGN